MVLPEPRWEKKAGIDATNGYTRCFAYTQITVIDLRILHDSPLWETYP